MGGQPTLIRMIIIPVLEFIDSAIYTLVAWAYELLMKIAGTNFFGDSMYEQFNHRIYMLLGLFMLFKLSFSLIKYIINPDEFNDKSKGGKKIILNVLIVLLLIITTPMIFTAARDLQGKILHQNVVGNLILGMNKDMTIEEQNNVGRDVSFMVFSAFYRLSPAECNNVYSILDEHYSLSDGNVDITQNGDYQGCITALNSGTSNDTDSNTSPSSGQNGAAILQAYANAVQTKDIEALTQTEVNGEKLSMIRMANGDYVVNYYGFISAIAGAVVAWIFLIFCFDIAVRMAKFAFLQLIAPIPIVSYIDPDSSKNGMFSKWVKECVKTYLDLFIRLAAVFFAIYLISEIRAENTLVDLNIFEKVIVIIGVLIFARQVPKLVQDLFGFKSDLKFNLSLGDRVRQAPVLGKAITTGQAFVGGGVEAMLNTQSALSPSQRLRSGVMGGLAGVSAVSSKVSWMGKDGTADLHALRTGRQAGYKSAVGTELRPFNPGEWMFRGSAERNANELKKYKDSLYNLKDELGMRQSTAQSLYSKLSEEYNSTTDPAARERIKGQMKTVSDQYQKYSGAITKVDKTMSRFSDQVKDYEKQYNLDSSPVKDVLEDKENMKKLGVHPSGGNKYGYGQVEYTDESGNVKTRAADITDTKYYEDIMNKLESDEYIALSGIGKRNDSDSTVVDMRGATIENSDVSNTINGNTTVVSQRPRSSDGTSTTSGGVILPPGVDDNRRQ